MITPEELMTKFANKHSYETWDELMYDSHAHTQIEYTKRVMLIYARISVQKCNLHNVSNNEVAVCCCKTNRMIDRFEDKDWCHSCGELIKAN